MGRHKTGRSALSLTTSDGLGSGDRLFVMIDASSIFAVLAVALVGPHLIGLITIPDASGGYHLVSRGYHAMEDYAA